MYWKIHIGFTGWFSAAFSFPEYLLPSSGGRMNERFGARVLVDRCRFGDVAVVHPDPDCFLTIPDPPDPPGRRNRRRQARLI